MESIIVLTPELLLKILKELAPGEKELDAYQYGYGRGYHARGKHRDDDEAPSKRQNDRLRQF